MFVGFDGFGVNRKRIKCAFGTRGVLSILKNDKGAGYHSFYMIVQEFIEWYTLYKLNRRLDHIWFYIFYETL